MKRLDAKVIGLGERKKQRGKIGPKMGLGN